MNITQVAKLFDLSAATLRYYESIGLFPPINRNKSGVRDYNEEDIKWIDFVKCMRESGLTIEALIEYKSLFATGDHSLEARQKILVDEREKLIEKRDEIDKSISRLAGKIKDYDGKLLERENKLKGTLVTEAKHE
ncbi:MerR family transcriptional regulator [Paenibacillus jilunlii]|uniref:Transcriptional regulator n=1 Tax=Paenibacillus jilunlii TaxID=682956 RepID=A0A1G9GEE1_9BACL|nr:MerR family transcriptional regulator [Paenibacillus jilunlii]KWX71452.1 transcriptional regulator [Paenibacillus jilunlii]SDK98935.1 DNA-binding transcriptional regulator, MerR family [Paenibacillus jilunlii]